MPMTDTEICSAALVKLGAAAIESFSDDSVEAEVAARLYEPTVAALLTAHPWTFATEDALLEPAPSDAGGGFSHAFLLPAQMLRTVSAGSDPDARGLVYRVTGTRLLANASRVFLRYQARVPESVFPPFFVQALIARLAAEFCIPITESTSRSDALHRLAAAELKAAKLVDSQQATPKAVDDFTLIAVRGR